MGSPAAGFARLNRSPPPAYHRSRASSRPCGSARARSTSPWLSRMAAQRLESSQPHSPRAAAMFARRGGASGARGCGLWAWGCGLEPWAGPQGAGGGVSGAGAGPRKVGGGAGGSLGELLEGRPLNAPGGEHLGPPSVLLQTLRSRVVSPRAHPPGRPRPHSASGARAAPPTRACPSVPRAPPHGAGSSGGGSLDRARAHRGLRLRAAGGRAGRGAWEQSPGRAARRYEGQGGEGGRHAAGRRRRQPREEPERAGAQGAGQPALRGPQVPGGGGLLRPRHRECARAGGGAGVRAGRGGAAASAPSPPASPCRAAPAAPSEGLGSSGGRLGSEDSVMILFSARCRRTMAGGSFRVLEARRAEGQGPLPLENPRPKAGISTGLGNLLLQNVLESRGWAQAGLRAGLHPPPTLRTQGLCG